MLFWSENLLGMDCKIVYCSVSKCRSPQVKIASLDDVEEGKCVTVCIRLNFHNTHTVEKQKKLLLGPSLHGKFAGTKTIALYTITYSLHTAKAVSARGSTIYCSLMCTPPRWRPLLFCAPRPQNCITTKPGIFSL